MNGEWSRLPAGDVFRSLLHGPTGPRRDPSAAAETDDPMDPDQGPGVRVPPIPVRQAGPISWPWVGRLVLYRAASLVVLVLAVLVLVLLVLSMVLSITAVGVLLLVLTLRLARLVVRLDAWLMREVLGQGWRWPDNRRSAHRGWARWWRWLTDPRGWLACAFLLVKVPLGLAGLYLPLFAVAASVNSVFRMRLDGSTTVDDPATVAVAVLVVLAAPILLLALTALDVQLGRSLARLATRQAGRAELLEHQRADLLTAASTARRRLERDLHDGTQARLTALLLVLDLARQADGLRPGAPAADLVDEAHAATLATIAELRTIVHGVSPPALTAGLAWALRDVVSTSGRTAELDLTEPFTEPDDAVALIGYYCAAELVNNATRHSGAAHVQVAARTDRGLLDLVVSDDGYGGADLRRGSGLRGLADRVGTVDGTMVIDSRPGEGTTVSIILPLHVQDPVTRPR